MCFIDNLIVMRFGMNKLKKNILKILSTIEPDRLKRTPLIEAYLKVYYDDWSDTFDVRDALRELEQENLVKMDDKYCWSIKQPDPSKCEHKTTVIRSGTPYDPWSEICHDCGEVIR